MLAGAFTMGWCPRRVAPSPDLDSYLDWYDTGKFNPSEYQRHSFDQWQPYGEGKPLDASIRPFSGYGL